MSFGFYSPLQHKESSGQAIEPAVAAKLLERVPDNLDPPLLFFRRVNEIKILTGCRLLNCLTNLFRRQPSYNFGLLPYEGSFIHDHYLVDVPSLKGDKDPLFYLGMPYQTSLSPEEIKILMRLDVKFLTGLDDAESQQRLDLFAKLIGQQKIGSRSGDKSPNCLFLPHTIAHWNSEVLLAVR